MTRRFAIGLCCLSALGACVDNTGADTAPVHLRAGVAPAEATQRVSLPGRLPTELSQDMLCTPSPDAATRAQASLATSQARVAALGTNLSTGALDRETMAIWRAVGAETGCWFDGSVWGRAVPASITVVPGGLNLHQFRPAGTMGVANGATASCLQMPGQTNAEAKANSAAAARERLRDYDRIETAFARRVEAEGSAAFQNSDHLEQLSASRDRIKAEYNCTMVFLDVPSVG